MSVSLDKFIQVDEGSARKIPKVKYYEDISDILDGNIEQLEVIMKGYHELHGKFQLMTASLIEQMENFKTKKKSLVEALEVIDLADKKKDEPTGPEVLFQAADCLFARARVTDPSKVLLWLGSNVLMEYSPDEARKVITKNLDTVETNIAGMAEDIGSLRQQTTVVEVAISRLHNYAVFVKKGQAASAAD